ncbi:hypothetical protein EXW72_10230 [Pseudomonas sp. BCA14]|uniref:hypothetical protein n=1 Tax=unclassified Pseudomonas TaxID=196821 RepID=UPI00106E0AC6|nr:MULTISPECIES: hypothetical protein [unclassified Pseudomonas]TFF09697.1 hypothetical protein EXW70_11730 [Pseudomonas sp. JMN1]TFF11839.1 hypothetical protein EXW71_09480 [Pseudomonas sp. BCA17]TFF28615.1 hypothetical protein EXW72_10230 [Pseudomonas sp. BCA14]
MIGEPMPNPKDAVIADLNRQMDAFFGAGRSVQEVAQGVSGVKDGTYGGGHSSKLRAERDRLAPGLKQLAEIGTSINKAAAAIGIDHKRARLIARENGFKFSDNP